MAFKMNGWSAGTGTGSSPNKAVTRATGETNTSKRHRPVKKAKTSTDHPFMVKVPEADSAKDHYRAKGEEIKAEIEAAKKSGDKEALEAATKKLQNLTTEVKQYKEDVKSGDAPGSYGIKQATGKMSDFPMYSAERKAEYDRRGWAYDDTITKPKEETKKNEPEADPTPDPTVTTATGGKMDDITEPEYHVSSGSGRKKTTAIRKDGKVMTDEYTHRNIGDKRKRTVTDTEKNRSITHKEKFDKKGDKKKDKKKITLPDGTVVKVKEKGGKKKVKVRKKGQLFARRVK